MWCKFEGVVKKLGDFSLRLDVSIPLGSIVAIMGPSGSGKTTVLKVLAGLLSLDEGRIIFKDRDITKLKPQDRKVGMVFQDFALFPHLSVLDNIAYGLYAQGLKKSLARERASELAQTFGIVPLLGRKTQELSGGEKQRVALARTIIVEPELVLFDEPLSSLDAGLRRDLREEIKYLQRQLGFSAFVVTHDQEEAFSFSDHIVLLEKGRIVQEGRPEVLYNQPKNEFAARFIGDGSLIAIKEFQILQSGARVTTDLGEFSFEKPQMLSNAPRFLLIRPHGLVASETGNMSFEVIDSEFVGPHYRISLRPYLPDQPLIAMNANIPYKRGTKLICKQSGEGLAIVP